MVLDVAPHELDGPAHPVQVLELVEHDEDPPAGFGGGSGQVEKGVQGRQRVDVGAAGELDRDPLDPEGQADVRRAQELVDARAQTAVEVLGIRPLEADRDVGQRLDAVQVDEDAGPEDRIAAELGEQLRERDVLPKRRGAETRENSPLAARARSRSTSASRSMTSSACRTRVWTNGLMETLTRGS